MHWLQTLDTSLFLFVNRSLVNPFFDRLMPVLSGNAWFIPLAVVAALGALCFGNARARLCALMVVLVVALGDPLIINTIKHAAARPRPFVTLPEARLFGDVGKGYVPPHGTWRRTPAAATAMPSSHAANWFAATMVAFLFYRRSLWFMLPLALGVSFSRIYNGVHYPSDVLAGAILGAGYAVAGIVHRAIRLEFHRKKIVSTLARAIAIAASECRIPNAKTQNRTPETNRQSAIRNLATRMASPGLHSDFRPADWPLDLSRQRHD